MANSTAGPGTLAAVARIDPRLLRTAAVGGLLGGLVLFFLMAGYNVSAGMGFLTILNVCFAAWVWRHVATVMTCRVREIAAALVVSIATRSPGNSPK